MCDTLAVCPAHLSLFLSVCMVLALLNDCFAGHKGNVARGGRTYT